MARRLDAGRQDLNKRNVQINIDRLDFDLKAGHPVEMRRSIRIGGDEKIKVARLVYV